MCHSGSIRSDHINEYLVVKQTKNWYVRGRRSWKIIESYSIFSFFDEPSLSMT